jgi:RsiW-degrading membrane proteinase PrsW (M82 family)
MTETTPKKSYFHLPTLIQVVLTLFGVLFAWGLAALMLAAGMIELFNPSDDPFLASTSFSLFAASFLVGGLLLAPIVYGVMRLSGQTVRLGSWWLKLRKWFHPRRMLFAYPLVLLLGYLSAQTYATRSLLLPLLNISALGIPVLVLVWLALRGLPKGSPQLGWGAFSLGLAVGPTVILFLEIILLILVLIWLAFAAGTDPALMEILSRVSMFGFEVDNPAMLDQTIGELLNSPQVLTAMLALLAVFVPVIEELFKPVSVWVLLPSRKLRPVDGWVIGALSGAGFALFENFGNASVSQEWIIDVLLRTLATIPHVFTAALMGYTLALARTEKKYGKALLTFAGVVAIHGAWNGAYVLNLAASVASPGGVLNPQSAPVFLVVVGVLVVGMLIALLQINRKLRRASAIPLPAAVLPDGMLNNKSEQAAKETQLDGIDYNTD